MRATRIILLLAGLLNAQSAQAQQRLACWLPQSEAYFALTSKLVEFEGHLLRESAIALALARAGLNRPANGWCTVVLPFDGGFARYHGELRLVPDGARVIDPSKVLTAG